MFTTFPKPYTLNTAPARSRGFQGTGPGGGFKKKQAFLMFITAGGQVASHWVMRGTNKKTTGSNGNDWAAVAYRSSTAGRYSFKLFNAQGVQVGPLITRTGMSTLVDAVNANANLNVYVLGTTINDVGSQGSVGCTGASCDTISGGLNYSDATIFKGGRG